MGSPNKTGPKSPLKQWVLYQRGEGGGRGGECMHGNCCKQKNENNKKIKLLVKVYTYVEGPTNCNTATSTTR